MTSEHTAPAADEMLGQRVRDDQRLVARRPSPSSLLKSLTGRVKLTPSDLQPLIDADPAGFLQSLVELARARLVEAHFGVLFPTPPLFARHSDM